MTSILYSEVIINILDNSSRYLDCLKATDHAVNSAFKRLNTNNGTNNGIKEGA